MTSKRTVHMLLVNYVIKWTLKLEHQRAYLIDSPFKLTVIKLLLTNAASSQQTIVKLWFEQKS